MPYPSKCFKRCLPQILLGPFLNKLSQKNYETKAEIALLQVCLFSMDKVPMENLQVPIENLQVPMENLQVPMENL